MIKKLFLIITFLNTFLGFSQDKLEVLVEKIPDTLLKDADRVVINREEINEILSQTTLKQKKTEINYILNEKGLNDIDISLIYDKLTKIKGLEFKIYDEKGELVKTYKEKDFSDTSLADGFSVLTDNRIKHLSPAYFKYPFFTKFDYETEEANTISIPSFIPVQSSNDRVVETSYQLIFPKGFSIKKNEKNLATYNVIASESETSISYKASNLIAPEYEELNVRYADQLPLARFSNNIFALGNVKGKADNWNEFGVWYYENFLKGLDQLPKSTITKMKKLTEKAETDVEKAKIIYEYVQQNTRYISIQIGLGGWRPFPAKDVDRLGYGDCKALTNYTKSLLESVGVKAYYTIIHASERIIDIDENTLSLQGNHVLLTLPTPEGEFFIECTNQKTPFGYLEITTANRKALVVKPDGAYFTETHSNNENVLKAHFTVDLSNLQKVKTKVHFENQGLFYNAMYYLDTNDEEEITNYLKNVFSRLQELNIINYKNDNNRSDFICYEDIDLESAFIGSKMGNDYMLAVNPFLTIASLPKKYTNRKTGFSIVRGRAYELKIDFILPENYNVSYEPELKTMESKFGTHLVQFSQENQKATLESKFVLKTGDFSKDDYNNYQTFMTQVVQNNDAKFIFAKN